MAKTTVKIEGIEEVVRQLQKRGLSVQAGLEAICTAGALVIEKEAADNAGGSIADEMMHETTARKGDMVEVSVGPSKEAWFARFVEFGTAAHRVRPKERKALKFEGRYSARAAHPGGRAQPFLRPALDTKGAKAQQAMAKKAEDLVE